MKASRLLVWWCFTFTAATVALAQETVRGKVVRVSDGDTMSVRVERELLRVRLVGIDAPELRQPFGFLSQRNLQRLIWTKKVTMECKQKDRYGRLLCRVWRKGQDVSLQQIRDGLAWHNTPYEHEQKTEERLLYRNAETEARECQRGLWSERRRQPPWEFRHRRR